MGVVSFESDLDLFDHFALQEVGRLLGIRNLYGSSIWASEALAAGHALIQDPVQHSLEDILSLEAPLFILNGWNGNWKLINGRKRKAIWLKS